MKISETFAVHFMKLNKGFSSFSASVEKRLTRYIIAASVMKSFVTSTD
jgi:hypothetical protein